MDFLPVLIGESVGQIRDRFFNPWISLYRMFQKRGMLEVSANWKFFYFYFPHVRSQNTPFLEQLVQKLNQESHGQITNRRNVSGH